MYDYVQSNGYFVRQIFLIFFGGEGGMVDWYARGNPMVEICCIRMMDVFCNVNFLTSTIVLYSNSPFSSCIAAVFSLFLSFLFFSFIYIWLKKRKVGIWLRSLCTFVRWNGELSYYLFVFFWFVLRMRGVFFLLL